MAAAIAPFLQLVPAATGWKIGADPAAGQIANCNPSGEQVRAPGEEHNALPEEPDEEEEEAASTGAAAGAAAVEGEEGAAAGGGEAVPAGGATEGAAPAGEATDGAAAGGEATEGAAAAGATEGAAAAGEAAGEAAAAPDEPLEELLDDDDDDDDPPDAPHFGPVGGAKSEATPSLSTEVPGSGNCTSLPSVVVQSVAGMLAMNMLGKEGVSRPERPGMA